MTNSIKLRLVHHIPKVFEPGMLYVSEEFGIAGHMCPCGCGNKIITPIGPTDWSLKIERGKPSLSPSIGNWQIPCRSHYWIIDGIIQWSDQWTEDQILTGREIEKARKEAYFDKPERNGKMTIFRRILNWVLGRK